MAKKKRSGKRSTKIPIGLTLGFGAAVLGGGGKGEVSTLDHLMKGNYQGAFNQTCKNMVGWDPGDGSFDVGRIAFVPIVVGLIISLGLGKLVNRRLRLPYIKL